ncbi:hypothetical protein JXI42_06505 [bacterium]|nr:hypothetical protein [bacterium]
MKIFISIIIVFVIFSTVFAADFRWEKLYFRVYDDHVLTVGDFYFEDVSENKGFLLLFPYPFEADLFKPDSILFTAEDSVLNADRRTHLIRLFIPAGKDHFQAWYTTPWEKRFKYILTSIYSWRHPLDSVFVEITYPSDMEIAISYAPDSVSALGDSVIAHYKFYDFYPDYDLEIRRED